MEKENQRLIKIDLDQFKLHIKLGDRTNLSLHFDSPSRRFYLSVIALVVHEMKKLGRITSIPLEEHYDLLALLNETVGGSSGSSQSENLLPRIYKKWKGALSDLENAPLFRVIGKAKEYGDAIGKSYRFTDEEKDLWANLFDYKGSGGKARLRFSLDRLGAGLDDVVITYKEDTPQGGEKTWDKFLDDLKSSQREAHGQAPALIERNGASGRKRKWVSLAVAVGFILVIGALAIWNTFLPPARIEPVAAEKMAFPLPDEPSIAVLPFVNMSEDPGQEYFADGITEEIIIALSRCQFLFVIDRNSAFTYKGKPVKVQKVAEELGVRYVLEGSVRKAAERMRITIQLNDAISGRHLWAERYDRDVKDIFVLQDEITVRILSALKVKFSEGERAQPARKGTENLDAYLKYLEARDYFLEGTPGYYAAARRLAEEAIALDPEFPGGYRILGWIHLLEAMSGTSKSSDRSFEYAYELAKKACAMDELDALNQGLLGNVYLYMKDQEKALATLQRAVELDPNSARTLYYLATIFLFGERPQEAVLLLEKAMRLSPLDQKFQARCHYRLGRAYRDIGRYEEAVAEYETADRMNPNHWATLLGLTATYAFAGREEDARNAAAELLRIHPKFSLEQYISRMQIKDQVKKDRLIEAWRKAGLK